MSSYNTNEFRSGLKILLDNDPYAIVENEFVKPGKGQAFNRVKIRNLKDRPRHRAHLQVRRIGGCGGCRRYGHAVPLQRRRDFWHFMVAETFEQYAASKTVVGEGAIWLKDGDVCIITLWNNVPLLVTPPAHVELKVVETDPGVRGDTATGGQKPAQAPNRCGWCACRSSSMKAK